MTLKTTDKPMSTASHKALENFDEAAKHHGLMQEYGTGKAVDVAQELYNTTKNDLEKRIMWLERKVRQLRHQNNRQWSEK